MSEKKHSCCKWWMMFLCCAIPLLLAKGMQYYGYQGNAYWLVLLLCPLSHMIMGWFMLKSINKESTET